MAPALLEVADLACRRGGRRVFDRLSFALGAGEGLRRMFDGWVLDGDSSQWIASTLSTGHSLLPHQHATDGLPP